MTREQALQLYTKALGYDRFCEESWKDGTHREMEGVVAAKSDRAGGKVIAWWGTWKRGCTPTGTAHKIRQAWKEMNK